MKNLLIIISPILIITFFSGCTAELTDPELNFEPPKYVEQMPSHEDEDGFESTGSIFGKGDNPLFSDRKAMKINDIVTVVISETASSSSSSQKSLSESDNIALGGGIFAAGANGGGAIASSATSLLNGVTDVGFSADTSSNYAGAGSAVKDSTFTTTVSARVVKVMQNGNYFISGRREILVDRQKQIVQISGVIRPYDINQDNQIDSSKISDAKILYKTQGDVDRASEQGWGTKAIEAVWPF
jgi:flagellar L-ring protein precursor FlgH